MIDAPVVSVHIPAVLRGFSGGRGEVTASGETVAEVIETLCHEYPEIRPRLIAENGELQSEIAIFLGGRSIRELDGLETPIELAEMVSIVVIG